MKTGIRTALLFLTLALLLSVHVTAAGAETRLFVNGEPYHGASLVRQGRICVPIRSFCEGLGYRVEWDDAEKAAVVKRNETQAVFPILDGNLIHQGSLYTPLRTLARSLQGTTDWDNASRTASVTIPRPTWTEEDLLWLARIIQAEAGGEPMEGKIAVGNTILARVESNEFPNTIRDVIFDDKYAVQYEPVANGTIWNAPDDESMEAARRVLSGEKAVEDCLYFFNPDKASSTWISDNRTYVTTIGRHVFYA